MHLTGSNRKCFPSIWREVSYFPSSDDELENAVQTKRIKLGSISAKLAFPRENRPGFGEISAVVSKNHPRQVLETGLKPVLVVLPQIMFSFENSSDLVENL